ncbi:GbsR/MarR family transcriptional regulator [Kiritimatiella glycovorans]|nr:ArsR family transcriptional regulator [Kiritimatiella glycovorans]
MDTKMEQRTISDLEREVIELFVRMAGMLNLPRSVGELYGLLFISPEPLCIDDLMARLNISKGSVSQGLRILRSFRAVKPVYLPGSRRDYYVAEDQLRRIAAGFVDEELQPHLESGEQRLKRMRELVGAMPEAQRPFLEEKVEHLENWHRKGTTVLPLVMKMIDR